MVPALSVLSNRRWLLSGDHVTFLMSPFTVSSLRASVPSALATNKLLRSLYASILPLLDHAAVSPAVSPSLRGDPPRIGMLQIGPLGGAPRPSTTTSSDPSS